MPQRSDTHPGERTVLELLVSGTGILTSAYEDYDTSAARERLAQGQGYPALALARLDGTAAPAAYPSVHDEADHELDLACVLVLNAPEAGESLERLVDDHRVDPRGALVFGCMLHLTGRVHAAGFWWQFAAGGESGTAAYCLYLAHRRDGEHRDAAHWRSQAAPTCRGRLPRPASTRAVSFPTPPGTRCWPHGTAGSPPDSRRRWRASSNASPSTVTTRSSGRSRGPRQT